eukprot:1458022-Karenia_brevis.AAC.1
MVAPGRAGNDTAWELTEPAEALLQTGVTGTAAAFKAQAQADEQAAGQLLTLLNAPDVLDASVWQRLFGAQPPRGTIARLVRRLGGVPPAALGFRNK